MKRFRAASGIRRRKAKKQKVDERASAPPFNINDLPREILVEILSYTCDTFHHEMCSAFVCKKWKDIITQKTTVLQIAPRVRGGFPSLRDNECRWLLHWFTALEDLTFRAQWNDSFRLTTVSRDIQDYTFLTKLTTLSLSNLCEDLQTLVKSVALFTHLTGLSIHSGPTSLFERIDLSPLSSLTRLRGLKLLQAFGLNQLSPITWLTCLTHLEYIALEHLGVEENWWVFTTLPKLAHLSLTNLPFISRDYFSSLLPLTSLAVLEVDGKLSFNGVTSLKSLINLRQLKIHAAPMDLEDNFETRNILRPLTNLELLSLLKASSQTCSILLPQLTTLKNLTCLWLERCHMGRLSRDILPTILTVCTNLIAFEFYFNEYPNFTLEYLSLLTGLRYLALGLEEAPSSNGFFTFSKLTNLTKFFSVNLDLIDRELLYFTHLTKLNFLGLVNNPKLTHEGVARVVTTLVHLTELNLMDCHKMNDLAFVHLTRLSKLQTLACSNTKITPKILTTLFSLPRLGYLRVDGCRRLAEVDWTPYQTKCRILYDIEFF